MFRDAKQAHAESTRRLAETAETMEREAEHERVRQEAEHAALLRETERGLEQVRLKNDPAAMDALRLLADGPHPTRALMAVLDDLRPPF